MFVLRRSVKFLFTDITTFSDPDNLGELCKFNVSVNFESFESIRHNCPDNRHTLHKFILKSTVTLRMIRIILLLCNVVNCDQGLPNTPSQLLSFPSLRFAHRCM